MARITFVGRRGGGGAKTEAVVLTRSEIRDPNSKYHGAINHLLRFGEQVAEDLDVKVGADAFTAYLDDGQGKPYGDKQYRLEFVRGAHPGGKVVNVTTQRNAEDREANNNPYSRNYLSAKGLVEGYGLRVQLNHVVLQYVKEGLPEGIAFVLLIPEEVAPEAKQ